MAAFPPPKAALVSGLKASLALIVPLAAVSMLVGGKAILPAVMGLMSAAVVPFCTRKQSAILIAGLVLTGVVSTLAADTWWAVAVVVVSCVAAGLASRVSAGVYGVAPIVAAVLALDSHGTPPLTVGLVMLGVSFYVVVVMHFLKFHVAATPVPIDVAIRHGVVMAVACGGATAIAIWFAWPKAYWLVMTLAIVLRPYAGASLLKNRQRIIGTFAGALIAVLLSPLPRFWQVVFAAVCLMLMFSYMILKNYVLQVTFMTPMVVFLVSSGTVTNTLQMDGLRLLYTASACVVGGLLAFFLARQETTA